jgi:hypothetical protein
MSVQSFTLPNCSIRIKILHRLLHDLVLSFSLILLLEISEHLLFLEDLLLLLLDVLILFPKVSDFLNFQVFGVLQLLNVDHKLTLPVQNV